MRIDFTKLRRAMRARSEHLGDFAILKTDALGGRADPEVEAKLAQVRGYLPHIDMDLLRRLPAGTFGREFARWMDERKLQPFTVTGAVEQEVLERNTFAVRYAVTHDMVHLLTGFDTTWAGELGVIAFAAAQGYSKSLRLGQALATVLYPLLAPRQTRRILQARAYGEHLGRHAHFVLGVRLEERWAQPLGELRCELGLPAEPRSGMPALLAQAA